MPDYRIGSFTRSAEHEDDDPVIVHFARLPRGGDISGDIGKVIAAIEFDLQQLGTEANVLELKMWAEHFAAITGAYDTSRIDLSDNAFVYAEISNSFLGLEPLVFETEDEFVNALNLPRSSYERG